MRARVSRVRVAVVDSGWDRSRGDPRVLAGAAFLGGDPPGPDDHDRLGHGTACILEVLRLAPAAEILPVRVFGEVPETSPEPIARAIRWAAEHGAQVVALSLGTRHEDARPMLAAACAAARRCGALLVSAGPNAGAPTYPAALPQVIGVWPARDLPPGAVRVRAAATLDLETGLGPGGTSLAAAALAGRLAARLAADPGRDPRRLLSALAGD